MHTVYLSLGTNLGDKARNIRQAIDLLGERVGEVLRESSFIETEPWGFESENTFLNAAVCVSTGMSPHDLLHETQAIERELGRTLKSRNGIYHDRVIDIDILLYDDEHINTPELTVPHPLMTQREFVMKPLKEILSDSKQVVV